MAERRKAKANARRASNAAARKAQARQAGTREEVQEFPKAQGNCAGGDAVGDVHVSGVWRVSLALSAFFFLWL